MKNLGIGTVMLIVFLLGCATSAITQFVVPPARAQGNVSGWEYVCNEIDTSSVRHSKMFPLINDTLNAYGKEGWELVSFLEYHGDYRSCFKRRL